jgi:hypothetical protein
VVGKGGISVLENSEGGNARDHLHSRWSRAPWRSLDGKHYLVVKLFEACSNPPNNTLTV